MSWFTLLIILFDVIALAMLLASFALYARFHKSAEKRWANRVFLLLREAERRVRSANRELVRLKAERDIKTRSLQEEAFTEHLRRVPVDALSAYPGIGPGTVGKLRSEGYVDLALLHRSRLQISGLGQKRLADVNRAVADLLKKARKDFDAGDCPSADSSTKSQRELSDRYDLLEASARRSEQAARQLIDNLAERVKYAQMVTFRRWLRPIGKTPLIPKELMDEPLPALEAFPQSAEPSASAPAAQPTVPAAVPQASSSGPTREESLKLLEIPANTPLSSDRVRRQYNLLSERSNPDKVASMGAEFVALAQAKQKQLRQAAEMLLDSMGEKLETQPPAPPQLDLRHNPDLDDVFGGS
jgi:hypothetical protein